MWYHNANCDAMSLFGGRHVHLITLVDDNFDGTSKSLYNNNKYRSLRKLLIENEGYMKSQQVRDLNKLCQHLSCPPRIYMGSIEATISRIMQQITPVTNIDYNTCITELPAFDLTDDAASTNSEWNLDTLKPIQSTDPLSTAANAWDEAPSNTWSDTVELTRKAESTLMNVKETFQDKIISVCKYLCKCFNVDSHEQLSLKIAELPDDDIVKQGWNTLQHRPGIANKIASESQKISYRVL